MTDILAACELLADTAAEQIPGIHVYPTLKDSPRTPGLVVVPASIDYEQRMGRSRISEFLFDVVLLAGSRINEVAALKTVYQWIDPAGPLVSTLDDLDNVRVVGCTKIGAYSVGEAEYIGATLQVRLID